MQNGKVLRRQFLLKFSHFLAFLTCLCGCVLLDRQPAPEPRQIDLGTIGVVSTATEPEIELHKLITVATQARTKSDAIGAVARGAIVGSGAGGALGLLAGALIGAAACAPAGLVAITCASMVATYGTAIGAGLGALSGGTYNSLQDSQSQRQALDDSAAEVGDSLGDAIRTHFDKETLRRRMSEEIKAIASHKTALSFVLIDDEKAVREVPVSELKRSLAPQGIDTLLELNVETVALVADLAAPPPLVAQPYLRTRAALVRYSDRQRLYGSSFEFWGPPRAVADWSRTKSWLEFSEDASVWFGEAIVNRFFLPVPALP